MPDHDYYRELWTDHPHKFIIDWVKPGSKVLDVGCGYGALGSYLAKTKNCQVTGIDVDADRAEIARQSGVTAILGSIEDASVLAQLEDCYDAVIMADVLEHLVDPWQTLVRCRSLLGTEGNLLTSIPNVAHFTMRVRLLFGQFEYTEHGGLRDRTHLRFFTHHSAKRMFGEAGYQVVEQAYRGRFTTRDDMQGVNKALSVFVRVCPNIFAYQMLFKLALGKTCQEGDADEAEY